MASAGSRGNRHTKSERLRFELGKSAGAIEKGFAQIWKTREPQGFRGICALADAGVLFLPQRCYEDMEKTTGSISGANRLFRSGTKIREKVESRSWKLILSSLLGGFTFLSFLHGSVQGQTNCEEGNGLLDSAAPKTLSVQEVIRKLGAAESATKEARLHYTYKQDVLMQTLVGKTVTGEFHEVTTVSYDAKGRRQEVVMFAAQPSLRGIQLTQDDMEDVRTFMPLILTIDDLPQYNLTYAGQQHVDDLDTYVFRMEPKKEEKGKRYFQGRIWVDAQDLQIVKVCGKSGPEKVAVKKHERPELHPIFVTYRQQVDDHYWFPAYTRSDDTLQFRSGAVHIREIIKHTGYKRVDPR
jgi:hypothetical protein